MCNAKNSENTFLRDADALRWIPGACVDIGYPDVQVTRSVCDQTSIELGSRPSETSVCTLWTMRMAILCESGALPDTFVLTPVIVLRHKFLSQRLDGLQ